MTSNRYHNVYEDGAVCFWTSSIVRSIPLLEKRVCAQQLLHVWDECRHTYGVSIVGYVIMPNHTHIALWAAESTAVQRFIKNSLRISSCRFATLVRKSADSGNEQSKAWIHTLESCSGKGSAISVWKERGRAFPVTNEEGFQQKLRYIHENPVRAGLVGQPEDWEFSSALWYRDGAGTLVMDVVECW